ncbi:MAG: HDIG domain-containing metalloprotein, partial [Methanohalophilus sp.]
SDLTSIGLSVGLVNAVLVFAFRFPALQSPFITNLDWPSYWWAVLSGLVSALFIAAAVPAAERITQVTSPIGLMELLNPSHPLMERLRSETPGTYHHSQNIASLGESAARAIGADPLLTKVGGYYHDIGKMVRPDFFIENQSSDSNPHDELTPSMSKIVLTSHIKQGINLGKRYGLREDVLNFIPSHHGTSLIKYFYLKALKFFNSTRLGTTDPIFGRDIGYYTFERPFLMSIYEFFSALALFLIFYTALYYIAVFAVMLTKNTMGSDDNGN